MEDRPCGPTSGDGGAAGKATPMNLFGVIAALQDKTGVHLEVRAVDDAA